LTLRKIKRPGGVFSFEVRLAAEDESGVWLHSIRASNWTAPHDGGNGPFDCLILLSPERYWVACWVDDPADKRLEIDVCLPSERGPAGWSYVDLELDVFQHGDGTIEIIDEDEFNEACRNGWIRSEDARIAHETASAIHMMLYKRQESLWEKGWQKLNDLRQFPSF
jgi:predicted RNA-binding protein associated with RNAse of E/G family